MHVDKALGADTGEINNECMSESIGVEATIGRIARLSRVSTRVEEGKLEHRGWRRRLPLATF